MTADRAGYMEPTSGVCCRHRVRHDDRLCCECGVEHRGDEYGRVEWAFVALCSALGALVLAASIVAGRIVPDEWADFAAALPLVAAVIPVLHHVHRMLQEPLDDEIVERHPAAAWRHEPPAAWRVEPKERA